MSSYQESIGLQSILFFMIAHIEGKTRLEAITKFTKTELCRLFGDTLTVGAVYEMATIGGYDNED